MEQTNTGGTMQRDYIDTAFAKSGSPALSFTGQGGNTAVNLYDFMYRECGIQGRCPSPDPLDTGAFNLADPQSLDLYAYVRNSPMMLTDPLGLSWNCHYFEATDTTVCTAGGSGGGGGGGTGACSMVAGHGGFGYGAIPGSGIGSEATCPPGDGKGGGNPPTHTGPPPKQPQNPQCTALQQQASQLALTLDRMSYASGVGGYLLGGLGFVSAGAQLLDLGTTTIFTVALPSGSGFFKASGIAPLAEFGADVAGIAQQAQDLANAQKGVCQQ